MSLVGSCRMGAIYNQIWQGWKNQTVRLAKPEYLVLAVFRVKPRKELNLKI
jgi:hypothetical protein